MRPRARVSLAQLDVVGLRAREVEQGGAQLGGLDDAHVDLRAAPRDHTGLRVAAPEDAIDDGQRHDGVHDGRGVGRRDDDVDVAARLGEAAQRAADFDVGDARDLAQSRRQARRDGQRHGDGRARHRAVGFEAREGLREVLLGLLAEALEATQRVGRERRAQIVERLDAQLGAQALHGLGPEALDAQQRDDAWRVLRPQCLELCDLARVEQLADLLGRALADVVDLLQVLDAEAAELAREGIDAVRCVLVGPHAERLRVALVEDRELGQLGEHVEDVLLRIGHGASHDVASIR